MLINLFVYNSNNVRADRTGLRGQLENTSAHAQTETGFNFS